MRIIHILFLICFFTSKINAFSLTTHRLNPGSTLLMTQTESPSEDKLFVFNLTAKENSLEPFLKTVITRKCQLSLPVLVQQSFYVLDANLFLMKLNNKGDLEDEIDLSAFFNKTTLLRWHENLLTTGSNYLFGIIPAKEGVVFAYDLESLHSPLWTKALPLDTVPGKPLAIKSPFYHWMLALPCYNEYLQQHFIRLFHAQSGEKAKDIIFRSQATSPVMQILAVDTAQTGVADKLFFATENEIFVSDLSPGNEETHQIRSLLGGLSQLIVGRTDKGITLYYVENKKQVVALLLSQSLRERQELFRLDINNAQLLLRQGKLIVTDNKQIAIFNGQTGEKLSKEPLFPLFTFYNAFPCPQMKQSSPWMLISKPREQKRFILVNQEQGLFAGQIDVDYEDLGRRVFTQK